VITIEVIKDSYGRKINYVRVSVTDRCNMRCKYCMPIDGIDKKNHSDILSFEQLYEIIYLLSELGINKVRLTGGEPLVRKGIVNFIDRINSIKTIEDLAMTTNGQLLYKYAEDLKNAGLKRLNISIDTLDDKKYSEITRGGKLSDTLRGIEKAKNLGFDKIKLNVVLIGGFNDDEIDSFVNITRTENIDVRFIELMPIGECSKWSLDNFISTSKIIERCNELEPITYDDISSPAKYYKLPNSKGKVGLINPISCKFCQNCNRIRITADGKLKNCLHSDNEADLKLYINDKIKLKEKIVQSIMAKPKEHNLENGDYIKRNMIKIGG